MTLNSGIKLAALENLCPNINYEVFQDEILMASANVGAKHYQIDLSLCTPTFLLKLDQDFLVLIIQGNRKIDFKKLKKYLANNKVSMASKEEILEICGVPVGSVSMVNPGLRTLVDLRIEGLNYCYGGCGIEKFTLKIDTRDLVRVTKAESGDFSNEKDI